MYFVMECLVRPIKTGQISFYYGGAGESEGFQPDAGEQAFSNYFNVSWDSTQDAYGKTSPL